MAHAFNSVPTSMYDQTFAALSPNAQRIEWMFRTSPHRATEGLFRIPLGYIEEDIGMSRDEASAAISELTRFRPFLYDFASGVVLDRNALRDNPLRNGTNQETGKLVKDKRMKGALARLQALPRTLLLRDLLLQADEHSPDFAEEIRSAFPKIDDLTDTEAPLNAPLYAPLNAPWHAPSREETSSDEERPSREESRDASEIEEKSPAETMYLRSEGAGR